MVLGVDEEISEDLLAKIKKIKHISDTVFIKFDIDTNITYNILKGDLSQEDIL